MTTEDRNKAIAIFDGYKFGYYETITDKSSGDDLGYKWVRENIPFRYRDESEMVSSGLQYEFDDHYRSSYRKVFYEPLPDFDYSRLLNYHWLWELLMPVVEKIEKQEKEVHIYLNRCDIYVRDKFIPFNAAKGDTKIKATFLAVGDYCLNYNLK